jgi:hypothetical protein
MRSLAGTTGGGAESEQPFLELLDVDDAKVLRSCARLRTLSRGMTLFHQGDLRSRGRVDADARRSRC